MCVSVPRRVPQQFGAHNVIFFIPLSLMQKNAIHRVLGKKNERHPRYCWVTVGSSSERTNKWAKLRFVYKRHNRWGKNEKKTTHFVAVCWMINTSFHSAGRGQFADKINCFGDWMQSCMEKKKTADRNQSGYKKIAAFNNTGWGKNKRREFERLTLIKPMVLLWDHPQLFWRPVASKKLPWRLDIPLTPLMLIKDSVMLSKPYFRDQEMLQE